MATHYRVDIDAIRDAHPISEIVTSYGIELRRAGVALVGRCPFHDDRGRPNLHVYRTSGRWICYRCGERGDVIGFVQRIEKLTFREALSLLTVGCPRATGVVHRRPPAPRLNTSQIKTSWGRDEFNVLAAAAELYSNQLLTNGPALGYMAARGFPRGLLERYHVGFATGDELVCYLRWRRLPLGAAMRTGLITSDGREFLAGRIVIPELRQGWPVWMIGRVLEWAEGETKNAGPKYLGLPGAKPLLGWEEAIRDPRGVCLVEGPMDLLALRRWGVPGIALTGSALRSDMLALLGRFDRVYLALDNDSGGHAGASRIAAQLGSRAVRIELPAEVHDVADLATLPHGEELFRAAILAGIRSTPDLVPVPSPGAI